MRGKRKKKSINWSTLVHTHTHDDDDDDDDDELV
jgi:hypothetical protein